MDSQLGLPSILFSAAASPTQTLVHTTQSEFCLFQIRCPFREREKKGGVLFWLCQNWDANFFSEFCRLQRPTSRPKFPRIPKARKYRSDKTLFCRTNFGASPWLKSGFEMQPKSRTNDIYGWSLRTNDVRRCTNMLRCNSMT